MNTYKIAKRFLGHSCGWIVGLASILAMSCRSSIKSTFVRSDEPPPEGAKSNEDKAPENPANNPDPKTGPIATEVQNALSSTRTYFQSRSVIELKVDTSIVKAGDTWSLENTTTGKTLIAPQTMSLAEADFQRSDLGDKGYMLMATFSNYSNRVIYLYPYAPSGEQLFVTGLNKILINVNGVEGPRKSEKIVYIIDGQYLSVSPVIPSGNSQLNRGHQGAVALMVGQPTVTNNLGFSLDVGVVPILNR